MLEVKARDAFGRVAELEINGKKLITPYLFPVIDIKKQILSVDEIKKMGFNGIITNAYLIKKRDDIRERALEKGIHRLLHFNGVVMTDSGSFQLSQYGRVEVTPEEIVEFQEKIGVDIGVILDIPTSPFASREQAERELEETLRRAEISINLSKKILLAGTIQGSVYSDLRERASKAMAELNFDLYPIGGVVPLLEDYRFADVVRIINSSKPNLPLNKPVHLFGAGHPMFFALAVALGCDLFDSAAYALYAREGRYITASGTFKLENLHELPCECEVCSSTTAGELKRLEKKDRERLLARHNLLVSQAEIKRIRQSIYEGSLWELVCERARAHPALLQALRVALRAEHLLKYEPVTKKTAFFYTGEESLSRPEVRLHLQRLKNLNIKKKLVLLPEREKPYSRSYALWSTAEYHICIASSVFGIIPLEVEEIYPLNQHEAPPSVTPEQREFMARVIASYASYFDEVYVHKDLEFLGVEGEVFESVDFLRGEPDIEGKLRAMGDYYFGAGVGEAVFRDVRVRISSTGRIREVYSGEDILAVIRASDGAIVLHKAGAERLLKLKKPCCRVVAKEEAAPFIRQGRNLFTKFVEEADEEIKPHQEVVVVDRSGNLLGAGRAVISAEEMFSLTRGVAVKVRHGFD